MPTARRSNWAFVAGLLLAAWLGSAGILAMAQDGPAGQDTRQAKGLLVAPATASGSKPAQIQLDLNSVPIPANAQLELSVEPTVVGNEKYVVVVRKADGTNKEIGAFSFFPPPHAGKVEKFLMDAEPIIAAARDTNKSQFDLSVQLVPVNRDSQLSSSALRVLGARLVGG